VITAEPFDLILAAALLLTGGLLLGSVSLLRAAVLFIAFGLLMSLAWVRLLAPDIALAEAAIGAGVTGVLLIDALRQMEWDTERCQRWRGETAPPHATSRVATLAHAAAGLAVLAVMLTAVHHLTAEHVGLSERVLAEMEELEHPVTAVLLVFRGFDTMLELGILVLAVLGMLTVRRRPGLEAIAMAPPRDAVLDHVVRLLVPLAVVVSGYLLWLGTFAPGGAFQGGVVLGAAGILLWLSRHRSFEAAPAWAWRSLVLLGFAAFLVAAGATMLSTGLAFRYPDGQLYALVQIIETTAALSVGASLAALFVGLHPSDETVVDRGRD
jgi:multisubunit Na+/H+ antiporter MnhB subunit